MLHNDIPQVPPQEPSPQTNTTACSSNVPILPNVLANIVGEYLLVKSEMDSLPFHYRGLKELFLTEKILKNLSNQEYQSRWHEIFESSFNIQYKEMPSEVKKDPEYNWERAFQMIDRERFIQYYPYWYETLDDTQKSDPDFDWNVGFGKPVNMMHENFIRYYPHIYEGLTDEVKQDPEHNWSLECNEAYIEERDRYKKSTDQNSIVTSADLFIALQGAVKTGRYQRLDQIKIAQNINEERKKKYINVLISFYFRLIGAGSEYRSGNSHSSVFYWIVRQKTKFLKSQINKCETENAKALLADIKCNLAERYSTASVSAHATSNPNASAGPYENADTSLYPIRFLKNFLNSHFLKPHLDALKYTLDGQIYIDSEISRITQLIDGEKFILHIIEERSENNNLISYLLIAATVGNQQMTECFYAAINDIIKRNPNSSSFYKPYLEIALINAFDNNHFDIVSFFLNNIEPHDRLQIAIQLFDSTRSQFCIQSLTAGAINRVLKSLSQNERVVLLPYLIEIKSKALESNERKTTYLTKGLDSQIRDLKLMQFNLFAKELENYLKNREEENNYVRRLRFLCFSVGVGYSKKQKKDAASALKAYCLNPDRSELVDDLQHHFGALNNGRLKILYNKILNFSAEHDGLLRPNPSKSSRL